MDPSKWHSSTIGSQSKGKSLSTGKKQNNVDALNSQVSEVDAHIASLDKLLGYLQEISCDPLKIGKFAEIENEPLPQLINKIEMDLSILRQSKALMKEQEPNRVQQNDSEAEN